MKLADTSTRSNADADPRTSLILARALRTAGDPQAAAKILRQLVARKNAAPELRIEFADALIAAGLFDEATGVLTVVAPGSKQEGEAQFGLARIQLKMNQPARALQHADRAILLEPANARFLVTRGIALDRMGRHPDAQASYRAALAVAPRSVSARNDLALSLALNGGYDQAIEILTPIARSASATPADRQNLAFVYGLKGDINAALALSRLDLDEATSQANLKFFAFAARAIP